MDVRAVQAGIHERSWIWVGRVFSVGTGGYRWSGTFIMGVALVQVQGGREPYPQTPLIEEQWRGCMLYTHVRMCKRCRLPQSVGGGTGGTAGSL